MTIVKFGTSGHRGIIGDTFSNVHVEAISYAISQYLLTQSNTPICVVGFDPRSGNDPLLKANSFTKTCIDTLNKFGITTVSYTTPVPTPLISWAIEHYNYDGGIILTASHNPKQYNGIKFNPKNGAPAPKHITNEIEKLSNEFIQAAPTSKNKKHGHHTTKKPPILEFTQSLKNNIF